MHRLSRRAVLSTITSAPFLILTNKSAQSQGRFVGSVVTEWIGGREMRLTRPYEFIDATGRRWLAPAGTTVDGASIPRVFWSLIGGPFEGLYRGPSVIHDYFCEVRTRKDNDVHRVFHEAMLVAGVKASRALIMYKAVATFGPKWPDPKIPIQCEILHENYDHDFCAQNSAIPAAVFPKIDRESLNRFADELEGYIDPQDMSALRQAFERT